jgi:hypothetical protein
MTELERRRTTVTLSGINHDWLAARARKQRRAFTQELDLLIDEVRTREPLDEALREIAADDGLAEDPWVRSEEE